jgi:UDP-N-acetylmuramate--alanine ligase
MMRRTLNDLIGHRIHFIGIGGAGMSGLARIALSYGIEVSGSDAKDSSVVAALRILGAHIDVTHEGDHVDGSNFVVFSTAISEHNPELVRARELGLPILTRAQLLAILMSVSKSIAVAGTHGKTTTSSMLAVALQSCGLDPSFAIGGTITASGSNAHKGTGELFVAEADESDGSFIEYHPFAAIVTNVEHDHVDFFATPEMVTKAFLDFAATINPEGFLIYCNDDAGSKALGKACSEISTVSYGTDTSSDLVIDKIELFAMSSKARVVWRGKSLGMIELHVPGHHNLLNGCAVLAMGMALGLEHSAIIAGLATFQGTGRRFELIGTVHGIRVVDDYGHHPTEIDVTLQAARRYAGDGRVIVIFQPHRYSRTQAFITEFAHVLNQADRAILLEVYAASEQAIPGISSQLIVDEMTHGEFIPNFIDATQTLIESAQPGDVIMTLGAGDVSSLAPIIAAGLHKRFSAE